MADDTMQRAAKNVGSTIVRAGEMLRRARTNFGQGHEPSTKLRTALIASLLTLVLVWLLVYRVDDVAAVDYVEAPTKTLRVQQFENPDLRDPDVMLIAIDEAALAYGDNFSPDNRSDPRDRYAWPWPRHVYNKLIRYCREGGARVIVFDFLFTESGPNTNEATRTVEVGGRYRRVWYASHAGDDLFALEATARDDVAVAIGMDATTREREDKDALLERYSTPVNADESWDETETMNAGLVANVPFKGLLTGLPSERLMRELKGTPEEQKKEIASYYRAMTKKSRSFSPDSFTRMRSLLPLPKPSMHGVAGAGFVHVGTDPADGVIRRVQPIYTYEGKQYRHLALETLRLFVLSYAREAVSDESKREAFRKRFPNLDVSDDGVVWNDKTWALDNKLTDVPVSVEGDVVRYLGAEIPVHDGRFDLRYRLPIDFEDDPAWVTGDAGEKARIETVYANNTIDATYPTVSAGDVLRDYDRWYYNNHAYPEYRESLTEKLAGFKDDLEWAEDEAERKDIQDKIAQTEKDLANAPEVPPGGWRTLRFGDPSSLVKDKVVFIAGTATSLADRHATPIASNHPGTYVVANVFDNVRNNDYVTPSPRWLTWLLALGLGVAAVFVVMFAGRLRNSTILTGLLGILICVVGWIAFDQQVWVPIAAPLAGLFVGFANGALAKALTEDRQRRSRERFARQYMGADLVDFVIKNPRSLSLGGENREMTVYFSDVAGFTTVTETLGPENPERLVELLNIYLERMTDIMLETGGVIDKYIGDAIMCFWGAPRSMDDHAVQACLGALRCRTELNRMQPLFADSIRSIAPQLIKPDGEVLYARAGINTGMMTVGNMGSSKRFAYTVMGDAVNLGARLEPQNKEYGTDIMIGPSTYEKVRGEFLTRRLDLMVVKGKTEPTEVFELVGEKDAPQFILDLLTKFEEGIDLFRDRQFENALAVFRDIFELEPNHDRGMTPSLLYIDRCKEFIQNPPPDEWNGVFIKTSK